MAGADGGAEPGVGPPLRWDVALSFASAQREYVEQVAAVLKARGMRCFYDADEQIELWGKYLAEELPAIYGEQSAAVVVFVSAEYAERDWTRLERRAALNRAVRERREYVLPARFDDTPLPGLLSDIVAVDLRSRTPQQFAAMIVDKLAALGITTPIPVPPSHLARTLTSHDDAVRGAALNPNGRLLATASWAAYREAVFSRHQWVRLQVISGAGQDREPRRIGLTEIFAPQLVVAGASWNDIPDEVRRYQDEIYAARPLAVLQDSGESDLDNADESDEHFLVDYPEQAVDVLGRERTQVILGGPGSGKSTLLEYAVLRICEPQVGAAAVPQHLRRGAIPFLVDLRNYVLEQDPDFVSHLVRKARDYYGVSVDIDSLNDVFAEDGKALVFCDGLDEVLEQTDRKRVIDQFQAFAYRYPGVCIVVTSRIAGYDRTALQVAGFDHYTLLPLTLGHVQKFAERWYRYYARDSKEQIAQNLVQRIIDSPRLLDLAGNPLLLTMMAVIYQDRELPQERWRLYERCAETLLEDWDLSKGIKSRDLKLAVDMRTSQKSEILQQVSMYMLEHSRAGSEVNAIAGAPLQNIIAHYLEGKYRLSPGAAEAITVDILRHLMERTYVLAGIGAKVFSFVHRTFMEYFAARRYLALFNSGDTDLDRLKREVFGAHWQAPEWEEVLLLLIAILHDQGTPIHDVVDYLRRARCPGPPFNLAFAARCLGEAGDVQDRIQGRELLTELAQVIARYAPLSREEDSQEFAQTALRSFASLATVVKAPPAVHEVITRLNEGGTVAARITAWHMGFALRSRPERLGYALAALDDPQGTVRRGAITALEREWPGRVAIGPRLAAVVRNDRHHRVRMTALAAIQRTWPNEPTILDAIGDRIDKETMATVVLRLIDYLSTAWRGNHKALDLVLKLAALEPRARGRYNRASIVASAAQAIASGWGGTAKDLAYLTDHARHCAEPSLRAAILLAIGQGWAGDDGTLDFLIDRASNDPDRTVRVTALQALGQGWRGNAQALAFLYDRASNDSDLTVRVTALQALGQGWRGNAQALAFLYDRASNDPDRTARVTALQALGQGWGRDDGALAFLMSRVIHEPELTICVTALQVIGRGWGGNAQALAFLMPRAINDDLEPLIRAGVLEALGHGWSGDARVLARLKGVASNDPDLPIRAAALRALGQGYGGDAPVLAFLKERASIDSSGPARAALLDAIRLGWGQAKVLAFLRVQIMKDLPPSEGAAALKNTVREWGDGEEVLAFLKDRAINDPDLPVRLAALQAIGRDWGGNARDLARRRSQAGDDPGRRLEPMTAPQTSTGDQVLAFLKGLAASYFSAPTTRRESLRVIAEYWGGDQVLAFLKTRAVDDADPHVRAGALRAIAQWWYDDEVLAFLRARGVNDPDPVPRAAVRKVLMPYQ
jgi:HEAT repeat protein